MSQINIHFTDTIHLPPTQNVSVIESFPKPLSYSQFKNDIGSNIGSNIKGNKLTSMCQKYNICEQFANRLKYLEGFETIIVCDDLDSMVVKSKNNYSSSARIISRQKELKMIVYTIVDVVNTINKNQTSIYFVNRSPLKNVIHQSQLDNAFTKKPSDNIGINTLLKSILSIRQDTPRLFVLVLSHTASTNSKLNIPEFKNILENEMCPNDYIVILTCIDDTVIGHLNEWDIKLPRLDVANDYAREKEKILLIHGSNFHFSFGDYVVKCLLGSIDSWFNKLSEINIYPHAAIYYNGPVVMTEVNRPNSLANSPHSSDSDFSKSQKLVKKDQKSLACCTIF